MFMRIEGTGIKLFCTMNFSGLMKFSYSSDVVVVDLRNSEDAAACWFKFYCCCYYAISM